MIARLCGTAIRLARAEGPISDAISELRRLADGRADLLAETAGVMGGYWSGTSDTQSGDYVVAFGLLIMAGADHARIVDWVELGRRRAMAPRHSV
jgi:hypothetical protein